MGKLNLEYFLARRIASYSKGARKNVMIRIATLSVTISVAVMIVSLAVILGFRKEITAKLTGFDAHIQIVHLNAYTSNETIPIDRDLPFLVAVAPDPRMCTGRSVCTEDRDSPGRAGVAGNYAQGGGQHLRLVLFPKESG